MPRKKTHRSLGVKVLGPASATAVEIGRAVEHPEQIARTLVDAAERFRI